MALPLALIIIVVFSVVEGVLLVQLWDWFIVPLGVKALTTSHAIGIAVIASMLTHQHTRKKNDETDLLGSCLFAAFLLVYLWVMGYVAHHFMVN